MHLVLYLWNLKITYETGTINLVQRFCSPTHTQQSSYKAGTGSWRSPEGWAVREVSVLIWIPMPALPSLSSLLPPIMSFGASSPGFWEVVLDSHCVIHAGVDITCRNARPSLSSARIFCQAVSPGLLCLSLILVGAACLSSLLFSALLIYFSARAFSLTQFDFQAASGLLSGFDLCAPCLCYKSLPNGCVFVTFLQSL